MTVACLLFLFLSHTGAPPARSGVGGGAVASAAAGGGGGPDLKELREEIAELDECVG